MPVVEATFCMVDDRSGRGDAIQDAMFSALQRAQAEGVTDPDTLRARMLAAKDGVVDPARATRIDAAVKRTLEAWAVTCPVKTLARQWEHDLPAEIVGVAQANFLALGGAADSERSRVYGRDAERHGGVPG